MHNYKCILLHWFIKLWGQTKLLYVITSFPPLPPTSPRRGFWSVSQQAPTRETFDLVLWSHAICKMNCMQHFPGHTNLRASPSEREERWYLWTAVQTSAMWLLSCGAVVNVRAAGSLSGGEFMTIWLDHMFQYAVLSLLRTWLLQ